MSPIGGAKILSQGDNPKDFSTNVSKAKKYGKEYAAFKGRDLSSGTPIEKNPDLMQCLNIKFSLNGVVVEFIICLQLMMALHEVKE